MAHSKECSHLFKWRISGLGRDENSSHWAHHTFFSKYLSTEHSASNLLNTWATSNSWQSWGKWKDQEGQQTSVKKRLRAFKHALILSNTTDFSCIWGPRRFGSVPPMKKWVLPSWLGVRPGFEGELSKGGISSITFCLSVLISLFRLTCCEVEISRTKGKWLHLWITGPGC